MLPIIYHNAAGSKIDLANLRIDPTATGYILRGGNVVYNGVQYSIPTDFSFPASMSNIRGNFWTIDGKTLRLAVYDSVLITTYQNNAEVMQALHAELGTFVNIPFAECSAHYDIATKTQSEAGLLVHRFIPAGVTPADKASLANPPLPLVEAYMESNSPKVGPMVRAAMATHAASPLVTARNKTWAELTDVERQAVNQKLAEKMGFVKTA